MAWARCAASCDGRRAASDTGYVGLQVAGGADDSGIVAGIDIDGGACLGLRDGKAARLCGSFHIAGLAERQRGMGQEEADREAPMSLRICPETRNAAGDRREPHGKPRRDASPDSLPGCCRRAIAVSPRHWDRRSWRSSTNRWTSDPTALCLPAARAGSSMPTRRTRTRSRPNGTRRAEPRRRRPRIRRRGRSIVELIAVERRVSRGALHLEPLPGGERDELVARQILRGALGLLVAVRRVELQELIGPVAEMLVRVRHEICRGGGVFAEDAPIAAFIVVPSGQQRHVTLFAARRRSPARSAAGNIHRYSARTGSRSAWPPHRGVRRRAWPAGPRANARRWTPRISRPPLHSAGSGFRLSTVPKKAPLSPMAR
jgi:hypothetical protein